MAKSPINIGNDSLFTLTGFADDSAGGPTFLNAATVEVTVRDTEGVDVPGITWPITMSFIAASSGDYEGVVDKAIQIVEGQQYVATIVAFEGTVDGEWIIELFGARRLL